MPSGGWELGVGGSISDCACGGRGTGPACPPTATPAAGASPAERKRTAQGLGEAARRRCLSRTNAVCGRHLFKAGQGPPSATGGGEGWPQFHSQPLLPPGPQGPPTPAGAWGTRTVLASRAPAPPGATKWRLVNGFLLSAGVLPAPFFPSRSQTPVNGGSQSGRLHPTPTSLPESGGPEAGPVQLSLGRAGSCVCRLDRPHPAGAPFTCFTLRRAYFKVASVLAFPLAFLSAGRWTFSSLSVRISSLCVSALADCSLLRRQRKRRSDVCVRSGFSARPRTPGSEGLPGALRPRAGEQLHTRSGPAEGLPVLRAPGPRNAPTGGRHLVPERRLQR